MAISELAKSPAIALGWVPYWNLRPLRMELARAIRGSCSYKVGHPAEVNRMLATGAVMAAPASSVMMLRDANLEMAFPAGIVSNGPVQSVYLGLSKDLSFLPDALASAKRSLRQAVGQARLKHGSDYRSAADTLWKMSEEFPRTVLQVPPRIEFTKASATGAMLARLFYRFMFGSATYDTVIVDSAEDSRAPVMELLIGDEALCKRNRFHKVIDLGKWWHDVTGLPCVFAVWQKGKYSLPRDLRHRIVETASLVQAKMRVEPSDYYPETMPTDESGIDIDLAGYWKAIQYRLGHKEISGLLLFLCLAKGLKSEKIDANVVVKILRWQEMGESSFGTL